MGAACGRPAAADGEAQAASAGGTPARRGSLRRVSSGGAPAQPSAPVRQADLSADWALLCDAAKLSAAAELPPDVVQARAARAAPCQPCAGLADMRSCGAAQRYWAKARDGNFHPDEFAEPHVVAVLARCCEGQPPEALRAEPAAGRERARAGSGASAAAAAAAAAEAPVLGYAFEHAGALPAAAGAAGGAGTLLVISVRSVGTTLDALAACDAEARGTLAPLPAAWRPAACAPGCCAHAAFLAAAQALHAGASARCAAHLAGSRAARVLLTGHGIGGAVAAVLALALSARHPGAVWWAGFGAPRPGDAAFAAAFAACVGLRVAVKHGRDCVPKLPAGARFAAAGEPLRCGRDDPYEALPVMSDLGDHALPRYLAALGAGRPAGAFGVFPPFELEALAPQRALASLANESYKAFQFWGQVADDVGGQVSAAVAAVPPPPPLPVLALPPMPAMPGLDQLLAQLPGGSSSHSTPSGTPRAGAAGAEPDARPLQPPPAAQRRGGMERTAQRNSSRA